MSTTQGNAKIRAFHKDVDAIVALAVCAALALAPEAVFDRVLDNPTVFAPLLTIVFGGRYLVRAAGARGK